MSKGYASSDKPARRIHPALLTVMFLVSIVTMLNFFDRYAAGVVPIPTPGPTQTAWVVAVVETHDVTSIPTRTATIEAYWLTRTAMPTATYAPPIPTRTPTPPFRTNDSTRGGSELR